MCIICAENSKPRIRNYKNFLIYFTNHYYLTDVTDKINLTFKKLFRKIEIFLQNKNNTEKEIAKNIRKDAKDIFEIVRLSRKSKTSFTDTVSIIIKVAYRTEIFENAENIEIAHQVVYQKIISKGNYLKLSEEETVIQLLSYIEQILYLKSLSKGKEKDIRNITY